MEANEKIITLDMPNAGVVDFDTMREMVLNTIEKGPINKNKR